jgi:hypothetical protein
MSIMQALSRRQFTAVTGLLAFVGATGGHVLFSKRAEKRGLIRLFPVEGVAYPESFVRFMERARFNSVRDALSSIRDRSLPVKVAHIHATDHSCPRPRAPRSMVCDSRRSGNVRAAAHFPGDARDPDPNAS